MKELKDLKPAEEFSNHAMQAYATPDCELKRACFWQATGFGGGIVKCPHFVVKGDDIFCGYDREAVDA